MEVSCALIEVVNEFKDLCTETNAFQHWRCDEGNDEVAEERISRLAILSLAFLLTSSSLRLH